MHSIHSNLRFNIWGQVLLLHFRPNRLLIFRKILTWTFYFVHTNEWIFAGVILLPPSYRSPSFDLCFGGSTPDHRARFGRICCAFICAVERRSSETKTNEVRPKRAWGARVDTPHERRLEPTPALMTRFDVWYTAQRTPFDGFYRSSTTFEKTLFIC